MRGQIVESMAAYNFRVAPLISGTFTFEGDDLVYRQGVRRVVIPLSRVNAFGVRERPAFLGLGQSQLIFRHAPDATGRPGRRQATVFDPASDACREVLARLRTHLPAADTTALPWTEAAARLGVAARPWYEGFLQPRSLVGMLLLGGSATAVATSSLFDERRPANAWAEGSVYLLAAIVAVGLIVSGFRRTRTRQRRQS